MDLLLLKGKVGKSVVLDMLSKSTKSISAVYYNQPVLMDALFVNSDVMDFPTFITELNRYLDKLSTTEQHYEYLIIYTNKTQITVDRKRKLYEEWENKYGFQVIIGCK